MSFILESPTERIDLGNPLEVLPALADAARAAGDVEYPALWGITQTNEEVISDDYLAAVRADVALLLRRSRGQLSERALSLLENLAATNPTVEELG